MSQLSLVAVAQSFVASAEAAIHAAEEATAAAKLALTHAKATLVAAQVAEDNNNNNPQNVSNERQDHLRRWSDLFKESTDSIFNSEDSIPLSIQSEDKETENTVKARVQDVADSKAEVDGCQKILVERFSGKRFGEEWTHGLKKENQNHRLIFRVNKDIMLHGIGLNVRSKIKLVIVNVCFKTAQKDFGSLYTEKFFDVDTKKEMLIFERGVPLRRSKENLIVLTLIGGSSLPGVDGKKRVACTAYRKNVPVEVVFTFETYKHKKDIKGKSTNAQIGLIESLTFDLSE